MEINPHFNQGLQAVTRTVEERLLGTNTNKRQLYLVSKGCFIISIPVESVKKHADYKTIQKIQKRVKSYPSDKALLDYYLETTRWNAYKEVLMGRMIKDIERRRCERKPGSMVPRTAPVKQKQTYSYAINRPATGQKTDEKSRATLSQQESTPEKKKARLPRIMDSPTIPKQSPGLGCEYPFKPTATIYAQGSRRNLVLVNGRIRTNTIQEVVEEQLLNRSVQVY